MESFAFSVIMAVYNTGSFLEEAVESLIHQTYGFEKIQLILVDDGSTDGSGARCDEYQTRYPHNVLALHKPNGGQSSARNMGVKYATGRYLNFMDSDDKMDANVFEEVAKFIQAHDGEVDVIAIPIYFFGTRDGGHKLNAKFRQGTRVIDLEAEWRNVQLSLASAFVRTEAARKYCFQEDLVMAHAEDARELNKLLIHNPKLGVVAGAAYRYRKWGSSTLDGSERKKKSYNDYVADFPLWIMAYSQREVHRIPKFLQYTVLFDLQWKIKQPKVPDGVLTEEEKRQYIQLIREALQYINEDVFQTFVGLQAEHKLLAWKLKHGKDIPTYFQPNSLKLLLGENSAVSLEDCLCRLEFFSLTSQTLTIEGFYSQVYNLEHLPELSFYVNGQKYPCRIKPEVEEIYGLDQLILKRVSFLCEVPLRQSAMECYLTVCFDGVEAKLTNVQGGPFFPISDKLENSYYAANGLMLRWKAANTLELRACTGGLRHRQEVRLLKELWRKNEEGYRKAIVARTAARMFLKCKRKPLWLISDRATKADDNGKAFFQFMQDKPEIDCRFVINKDCADFERMAKVGKVVDRRSLHNKVLALACDAVISSQMEVEVYNPFNGHDDPYHDLYMKRKVIFLQHGIIQNDLSGWLKRSNKNLSGFVVSAKPEYSSIVHGQYGYPEKNIWLTGMPRYDLLEDHQEKIVYIVPTWRRYLMDSFDEAQGVWRLGGKFTHSRYLAYYHQLLTDERLMAAAKKYGYRIAFFPHPNLQPFENLFVHGDGVSVVSPNSSYREIYQKGSLLVTDYSSVVFDFAYMNKPVLYTQFDKEEFFSGGHVCTAGYFDYERDGFGEVEYDLTSTVDRMIEYMANGCQMKPEYRRRVDEFFAYHDRSNCQRVYEKVMEAMTEHDPKGK